ncbi:MAG: hypothetical protein PVI92_08815 [Chromatiales bacterium]
MQAKPGHFRHLGKPIILFHITADRGVLGESFEDRQSSLHNPL